MRRSADNYNKQTQLEEYYLQNIVFSITIILFFKKAVLRNCTGGNIRKMDEYGMVHVFRRYNSAGQAAVIHSCRGEVA